MVVWVHVKSQVFRKKNWNENFPTVSYLNLQFFVVSFLFLWQQFEPVGFYGNSLSQLVSMATRLVVMVTVDSTRAFPALLSSRFPVPAILLGFSSGRTFELRRRWRWKSWMGWVATTKWTWEGTCEVPCPCQVCKTGKLPEQFRTPDQS